MNKTVWMLWLQGWDKSPSISRTCVESWKYYNPDWDIKLLDLESVCDYIDLEDTLPNLNNPKCLC